MFDVDHLGGYRLESQINSNSLRQVWTATSPKGDPAVVKFIPLSSDPQVRQMIEAERYGTQAHDILCRRDQGRHIPHIYATGTEGGAWYVAMQRVDGIPLHECAIPKREALTLVLELARCLVQWQGAGATPIVVHGDLKPSNLMRDRRRRLWVVDFGAARIIQNGPAPDLLCSTPYGSPERLETKTIDARADRWALMVIFYELLTCQRPFDPPAFTPRPPQVPGLDRAWYAVLAKGLELDPARRYPSPEALLADLEALAAGRVPAALAAYDVATECVARPPAPVWKSRPQVWLPLAVLVLYHIPIIYSAEVLAHRIQSGRIGTEEACKEYLRLRHRSAAPLIVAHPGRALAARLEAAIDRDLRQPENANVDWSVDATRVERLRSIDPTNPRFWMKTEIVAGRTALAHGKVQEAIQRFMGASKTEASAPDPYLELARLYATAQPDSALLLKALEQARQRGHALNANDRILLGWAFLGEGDLAAHNGDKGRAVDRYRRALKQFQEAKSARLERLVQRKLRRLGD